MVVAMLGVLKAGALYVPASPSEWPVERCLDVHADCQAKFVLASEDTIETAKSNFSTRPEITAIDITPVLHSTNRDVDHTNPVTAVVPSNLAYTLFTSGSTGKPKGVMLEHNGVVNMLCHNVEQYYASEPARNLLVASYTFDVSVQEIFSTLQSGGTLVTATKLQILSDITGLLADRAITHLCCTTTLGQLIDPTRVPKLHIMMQAGEALAQPLFDKWVGKANVIFVNGYGPTEASV